MEVRIQKVKGDGFCALYAVLGAMRHPSLGTHHICVDFINLDSDDKSSDATPGSKRESDDREWIRVGKVGKRKQRVDNKHETQRKVIMIR